MNPILKNNGEIDLIVNKEKIIPMDSLEDYQTDHLLGSINSDTHTHRCLMEVETIIDDWLSNLTSQEWAKMYRQQSLWGIKLPEQWIKVWRFILKMPELRDSDLAVNNGRNIGTYTHLWNMWAEDCIDKYLGEMDKRILWLVDNDYLYQEIGEQMLAEYGDKFWKPRKKETKTTPAQVINYYLYWKLPNKIVRGELWSICKIEMNKKKKSGV